MPGMFSVGKLCFEAVVRRDRRTPDTARLVEARAWPGSFLGELLVLLNLHQLRSGASQLLAHDRDLVLHQMRLSLALSQLGLQVLIVLIERSGPALQILDSAGRARLRLLQLRHLALQGVRILSAAGENQHAQTGPKAACGDGPHGALLSVKPADQVTSTGRIEREMRDNNEKSYKNRAGL